MCQSDYVSAILCVSHIMYQSVYTSFRLYISNYFMCQSDYVSAILCVSHIMCQSVYYLHMKYCRHVSFQEPVDINRKRTALPKKTITTLTFAEGKLFIALLILFVY